MLYKKFTKTYFLNNSETFNTELKKASDRRTGNKLKVNLNKTRSTILQQSKNSFWKSTDLNVIVGKTVIKNTSSYKYFGIIIDRILEWSEDIETIKIKLQKNIRCII